MEMPDLDDSDLKALKISPLANMENSDRGDQDNSNSKIPVKSAIDLKNDATIGLDPDTIFGVAADSNLVSQEVTVQDHFKDFNLSYSKSYIKQKPK